MSLSKRIYPLALLLLALTATAQGLPDFSALVEQQGAAVVNISSNERRTPIRYLFDPDESGLEELVERFLDEQIAPDFSAPDQSLGSGFFISSDGYVVTNAHVVATANEIIVRTSDRREFTASVVGTDAPSDIALLKIDGADLPKVDIGSAATLKVGAWVLAIGSPFGFEHSATAGIVSAIGRSLPSENYVPFIQTDVAINPGNSGGPLFALDGRVIGVNSQIYSRTGGFMGLSFAIPIDVAMDVVEQLRTSGRVTRGWLGVMVQDLTRELAETFGLDQPRGTLVTQVLANSPAQQAKLRAGDVILAFNQQEITASGDLPPLVGSARAGSIASLQLLRHGKVLDLELELAALPDEDPLIRAEPISAPPLSLNRIGVVVRDTTPAQRERFDLSGAVIIEQLGDGAAQRGGLRVGDFILEFDGTAIRDRLHFEQLLETAATERAVAVLVQREQSRLFYALRLPPAISAP